MNDEDELDENISDDSGDNEAGSSSGSDDTDIDSDSAGSIDYVVQVEEQIMISDDSSSYDSSEQGITQAEVYENLKRIGELEDEKQKIQEELRERTEQLRSVLKHIDRNSILYKMLQSALPAPAPRATAAAAKKAAPQKPAAKKPTKKKARRKS